MGIVDKFIRNPFKKSVDKEMEKIIKSKKYTADELTKKEIGKIRREAAENVLKRNVKIAAGVGITCSLIGATYVLGGSKETEDPLKDDLSGKVTTVEETASNRENQPETKSELDILLDEIDAIDSKEDALSFFKKMYLKQYNEEHSTNLTENDIEFKRENQAWMYDIGEKCVTRGSYPQGVENKLESNNIEYKKQEKLKLYNVDLITENGKETLESTTIQDSNIKKVVLGDEYLDGKSLDSSNINTLYDLTRVMNEIVELADEYEKNITNEETPVFLRKENLRERITEYIDAKMLEQQVNESVEMEIGAE